MLKTFAGPFTEIPDRLARSGTVYQPPQKIAPYDADHFDVVDVGCSGTFSGGDPLTDALCVWLAKQHNE
jgi:hypothetical protein